MNRTITKGKATKKTTSDDEINIKLTNFDVPTFNVGFFERALQLEPEGLTLKSQQIMRKPATERTEDEIEAVQAELRDVEFFQRFPQHVQYELCKGVIFLLVNCGRLILKEGQVPVSMYVVVSGIVRLFRHVTVPDTSETHIMKLGEYSHGMFFGYEDILHERNRSISARCKITAQLLEVDKELFQKLIRKYLVRDNTLILKSFRTLETFSHFEYKEEEYADLLVKSKIRRFPAHTIIFGGTTELPSYVYFIISGDCALEQEVDFIVETGLGFTHLRRVPPGIDPDSTDPKIHRKRLEIGVLMRGHYFGMGEDLSKRYIRSLCMVEVLMIPRHLLVAKRVDIFDNLKEQFENSIPPLQEILNKYLEVLNWQRYQTKVLREVFSQAIKKEPSTTKPRFVKYV